MALTRSGASIFNSQHAPNPHKPIIKISTKNPNPQNTKKMSKGTSKIGKLQQAALEEIGVARTKMNHASASKTTSENEHIARVADLKRGKHSLPYGFLLFKVFQYFKVPDIDKSYVSSTSINELGTSSPLTNKGQKREMMFEAMQKEIDKLRNANHDMNALIVTLNEKLEMEKQCQDKKFREFCDKHEKDKEEQARKHQELFNMFQQCLQIYAHSPSKTLTHP